MEGSAELLLCTPETNTVLCINYTSTVKKWEKSKSTGKKNLLQKKLPSDMFNNPGQIFHYCLWK